MINNIEDMIEDMSAKELLEVLEIQMNEIQKLNDENEALRSGLLSAAHEIGFLSGHLRGRMAQGAIEEMANKADQWVALASQGAK